MRTLLIALAGASALLAGASAMAQTVASGAWARATVPAQTTGGAYLTLRSADAARLVGGSTPAASSVEIHTMEMKGSTMSMREVTAVALPAGQAVSDFHLMLIGLKQPLKAGHQLPLRLEIEHQGGKRETLQIEVAVQPINYRAPGH